MQITFNIPDEQVDRIKAAVEDGLGIRYGNDPADPANQIEIPYTNAELLAEFKRLVREFIKNKVFEYEVRLAADAAALGVSPVEVTDV